jgi:hypothetical protein
MKYIIGNQTLLLDSSETKVSKEAKGTPHQVVGWRDCAETCRNLDTICNVINSKETEPLKIVDGIARAGFWSAVFRNKWSDCILHLNDSDESCLPVLKRNFPNDKITNYDIRKWAPKSCDLVMLDFDFFTLKKFHTEHWEDVITNWDASSKKYLILADGACFGFKFGNMKHYGIKEENEYYYLLRDELKKYMSKKLTVVSKFNNSSIVLFEETKTNRDIKFLPPSSMSLFKGNKPYGNSSANQVKPLF